MNKTNQNLTSLKKINKWILALLIIGILLAAFFGFRTVRSFLRIQRTGLHPGMTDVEAVRGWMTIPYISRMYNVPPDILFRAIEVQPEGNEKKSLSELNQANRPGEKGVYLNIIKQAILTFQATHPAPPPPPQPPKKP